MPAVRELKGQHMASYAALHRIITKLLDLSSNGFTHDKHFRDHLERALTLVSHGASHFGWEAHSGLCHQRAQRRFQQIGSDNCYRKTFAVAPIWHLLLNDSSKPWSLIDLQDCKTVHACFPFRTQDNVIALKNKRKSTQSWGEDSEKLKEPLSVGTPDLANRRNWKCQTISPQKFFDCSKYTGGSNVFPLLPSTSPPVQPKQSHVSSVRRQSDTV